MPERPAHVPAECSGRSLSDEIEDKPSTSTQSEIEYGYQALHNLESMPMATQSSSEALKEEELLDVMLLLYHLGISPNFRQASDVFFKHTNTHICCRKDSYLCILGDTTYKLMTTIPN
jgi:hypothetical protein